MSFKTSIRKRTQERLRSAFRYHNDASYRERIKTKNSVAQKKRIAELKQQVYRALGNKCAKCGYDSDSRAFQIDHLYDDGYKERMQSRRLASYYKSIIAHGSQEKYQLLCANCNQIKRLMLLGHQNAAVPAGDAGFPGISTSIRSSCTNARNRSGIVHTGTNAGNGGSASFQIRLGFK